MDVMEYTGQFVGGPDEGNLVTSSTHRIPVVQVTELWLDGKEEGKTANIRTVTGVYVWNEEMKYFVWCAEGIAFITRSPIE